MTVRAGIASTRPSSARARRSGDDRHRVWMLLVLFAVQLIAMLTAMSSVQFIVVGRPLYYAVKYWWIVRNNGLIAVALLTILVVFDVHLTRALPWKEVRTSAAFGILIGTPLTIYSIVESMRGPW